MTAPSSLHNPARFVYVVAVFATAARIADALKDYNNLHDDYIDGGCGIDEAMLTKAELSLVETVEAAITEQRSAQDVYAKARLQDVYAKVQLLSTEEP